MVNNGVLILFLYGIVVLLEKTPGQPCSVQVTERIHVLRAEGKAFGWCLGAPDQGKGRGRLCPWGQPALTAPSPVTTTPPWLWPHRSQCHSPSSPLSTGAPHTWHHSPAPSAAAVLGFLCQEQPGHPPAQAQSWAAGSAFQSQGAAPVSSHRASCTGKEPLSSALINQRAINTQHSLQTAREPLCSLGQLPQRQSLQGHSSSTDLSCCGAVGPRHCCSGGQDGLWV